MDIIKNNNKINIRFAFLSVLYFFIFFFGIIKIILGNDLYFYTLKQQISINNEKYSVESFGKLLFNNQKKYLHIQIKNANYCIYKEIDNEFIRLSNNFYEKIESKINKENNLYKSNGDYKFNSFFYPIYYVVLFLDLYKNFNNKLTQNIIFNYANLFIKKNQNQNFVIKEIYKNKVVSNGEIYVVLKGKKIESFNIVLKYKDLSLSKDLEKNNNNIDINDAKVDIILRRIDK
ncbi:MAG: hypothetical protein ACP5O4_03980 [bacterium]